MEEQQDLAKELNQYSKVSRSKFWEELTDAEKVYRLSYYIVQLMDRVNTLEQEKYTMREHSHDTLGRMVVPIDFTSNQQSRSAIIGFAELLNTKYV